MAGIHLMMSEAGARNAEVGAGGLTIRDPPSRRSALRLRAAWGSGMLVSVLFHTLIFLSWPAEVIQAIVDGSNTGAAYERPDPAPLVQLPVRAQPAASSTTPQTSTPHVVQRVFIVAVRQMAAARTALDLTPASPRPRHSGIALSIAGGASGSPEGELESADDRYVKPIARDILLDWGPSEPLYDVAVTARAHLDAAGRPTGPVELVPPTENQLVNDQIVSRVRTLAYQPARRGGKPVAAWVEITFVFCGISVKAISPAAPLIPDRPCRVVAVR